LLFLLLQLLIVFVLCLNILAVFLAEQASILKFLSPVKNSSASHNNGSSEDTRISDPSEEALGLPQSDGTVAFESSSEEQSTQNTAESDWIEDDGVDELLLSLEPMDDFDDDGEPVIKKSRV
jgi:hypothetical protein